MGSQAVLVFAPAYNNFVNGAWPVDSWQLVRNLSPELLLDSACIL